MSEDNAQPRHELWHAERSKAIIEIRDEHGREVCYLEPIPYDGDDLKRTEFNASVIEAAPAMLQFLEELWTSDNGLRFLNENIERFAGLLEDANKGRCKNAER